MINLFENKYDRKILKENIQNVKLIDILKTQKIDVTFAVRYILNKKYQKEDDCKIYPHIVLYHQKHILKEELINALKNYDSDDDSIDDFVIISNKQIK